MPAMSSSPHMPHVEEGGARVDSLSWPSFLGCLAILLAIFVGLNPIWETLDVTRVDENIWWSYAPIPLLVAAALAWERKWSWSAYAIEMLRLTLVKFAITYVVANTLWVIAGAPPAPTEATSAIQAEDPQGIFTLREAPAATPLDAGQLGALEGRVTDAAGAPVAGAFVWVAEGLEGHVFEPPSEPLVLRHDGHVYSPSMAVVQAFREVELVADGDALHTVYAVRADSGRRLFNDAFPPGTRRRVSFPRSYGLVTLGCRVPDHEHEPTSLLVVDHPFAAVTDADGRFAFDGVPAGELVLSAQVPGGAVQDGEVNLASGETASASLVLQVVGGK